MKRGDEMELGWTQGEEGEKGERAVDMNGGLEREVAKGEWRYRWEKKLKRGRLSKSTRKGGKVALALAAKPRRRHFPNDGRKTETTIDFPSTTIIVSMSPQSAPFALPDTLMHTLRHTRTYGVPSCSNPTAWSP